MNSRLVWIVAGALILLATYYVLPVLPPGGMTMAPVTQTPGQDSNKPATVPAVPEGMQLATFGTGCFWCTEALFQRLKGVHSVVSGYSGGHVKNPTYEQVSTKTTGHAEVIQVTFDPKVITYAELLEVFWKTHDPTTKDRQGNDVGPQYRSAIFYHSEEQKKQAEEYKQKLDKSGAFTDPIVTEITEYKEFFAAESYHQNFFNLNGRQPYCSFVIRPKVDKFNEVFKDKLKAPEKK